MLFVAERNTRGKKYAQITKLNRNRIWEAGFPRQQMEDIEAYHVYGAWELAGYNQYARKDENIIHRVLLKVETFPENIWFDG